MDTRRLTLFHPGCRALAAVLLGVCRRRHHAWAHQRRCSHRRAFGLWVAPPPYITRPVFTRASSSPLQPSGISSIRPDAGNYWYYWQQAGAYYPQVQQCPVGWIRVPPR